MEQHGLDVFAGAQPIDAKVHAIAGELPLAHVANLDRVSQSAARVDAKIGEDRMARIGVGDAELFRLRAHAAAVDFVLVGRAPIVRRRHFDFLRCFSCHLGRIIGGSPSRVKAELLEVIHALFTGRN